ncbi:hypothetical protein [Enterococcus asini]|uniref:hypothetical protein n=1 Tax=Enterococcus asini TaxID=57732 RepID=UPI0022E8C3BB|nr:hypothetical protein [Enterococcus asini]
MARKKDNKLKPGMRVYCIGDEKWKHPFRGVIEFVRESSVVVIIESTHEEDDYLIDERHGKTVVNKKKIQVC